MLNLDTHILIHALSGDLTKAEEKLLAKEEWTISSIVLWEISKLTQLGRIAVDLHDPDFVRAVTKLRVWPITLNICQVLRLLDFKSDPADEIIAATSVVHEVPLVTRDERIRSSKMVPLAS